MDREKPFFRKTDVQPTMVTRIENEMKTHFNFIQRIFALLNNSMIYPSHQF